MAEQLEFYKMSGAGNDFILVDNRQGLWSRYPMAQLAVGLCRRGLSVGADGFILVENSNRAQLRLRIFNRDGTQTPMCGNGARCAARYAFLRVMAGKQMTMETPSGVLDAEILSDGRVRIEVPGLAVQPRRVSLAVRGRRISGLFTDTGVPHLVVFVKDVGRVPVQELGRILRTSEELGPDGANVNFVEPGHGEPIDIRTFERGVEAETLACGTGATAVAWVLHWLGKTGTRVRLMPRSGKELIVDIDLQAGSGHLFRLTGEARVVCRGFLSEESIQEALS
jgi:diaminopimelate epimerase